MSDPFNLENQEKMVDLLLEELQVEFIIDNTRDLARLTNAKGLEITQGCLEDVWQRACQIVNENGLAWEVEFED